MRRAALDRPDAKATPARGHWLDQALRRTLWLVGLLSAATCSSPPPREPVAPVVRVQQPVAEHAVPVEPTPDSAHATGVAAAGTAANAAFPVFDNMFFEGKPDTAAAGLLPITILYENKIWPNEQNFGMPPGRDEFEATVRRHLVQSGPVVLDIERLPLKGPPGVAQSRLTVLGMLADWARVAAPGRIIGFYGSGTLSNVRPEHRELALELAHHVDAMFPPLYTRTVDPAQWEARARTLTREAREIGPGKPVFCYLQPQYKAQSPRPLEFIEASYWKYELEACRRYCNGIVIWGRSRQAFDNSTGWWTATVEFVANLEEPRDSRSKRHEGRSGESGVTGTTRKTPRRDQHLALPQTARSGGLRGDLRDEPPLCSVPFA
ncbi:MAG: hypothetical protein JW940_14240 [Polyangiaceae bacterium]|nr:hypothetical protein [Polyangiaceae bacterium]